MNGGYAGEMLAKQAGMLGNVPVAFTLGDRINQAVAEASRRLEAANKAREILDKYPEIEELVNLLGQF